MTKCLFLCVSLLASSVASVGAQGSLWVVAPAPGPDIDFTNAQDAVDAASDFDLILFQPGVYGVVEVIDKDLRLVGQPGARIGEETIVPWLSYDTALTIRDLSGGKSVVVRGLELWANTVDANGFDELVNTVEIQNCLGTVLFEDCDLNVQRGGHVVDIDQSDSVALHRCRLQSIFPFYYDYNGEWWEQAAIRSQDSDLYLWDSTVAGSLGPDSSSVFQYVPSGAGGDGVLITGGSLTLQGTSIVGGDGGDCCSAGGDGIRITGGAEVRLLDSMVTAGQGGGSGAPGSQFAGSTSNIAFNDGLARNFEWASPIEGGAFIPATLQGEPGDFAFLLLSTELDTDQYSSDLGMTLVLPASPIIVPFGVLPAGGLTLNLSAPLLPTGTGFLQVAGQVGFLDTSGKAFLTGPSVLEILNQDEL